MSEILRDVVVKVAQFLAGQSITVTQRGAQAYAQADRMGKPVLVNIPFIPDNASDDFCAAIQGFIDHEIGHVLHTDWKANNKIRAMHGKVRWSRAQGFPMREPSIVALIAEALGLRGCERWRVLAEMARLASISK